jgi:hypothetical protein
MATEEKMIGQGVWTYPYPKLERLSGGDGFYPPDRRAGELGQENLRPMGTEHDWAEQLLGGRPDV